MDFVDRGDDRPEPISIARCRELLGDEADTLTDQDVELDVEGILAFAERILPRASDLWVQASLDYKQGLQQLFFPEGVAYDGNRFNRTAATAPLFNYLAPSESADEKMVSRLGIEPRTRRLRAIGAPSSGVQSVVLSRKYGGSPSTGVLRLDLCPAVSVSVGVSASGGDQSNE